MKSTLSIILSLAIVLAIAIVPFGAATYTPSDLYTVSSDTPTCEEAILACGGDLNYVQKVYFQLPAEDTENPEDNWTNHYNSTDLGLDYCQVCVFWWMGIGSEWPGGTKAQWVGYKTKLIDAENRIYEAVVPADGGTANIIWNNGVNGGTDSSAEIFSYAHQLKEANVEGAEPGDYDTLPEGSPDPDSMDGCIQVTYNEESTTAVLPNANLHSFDWYVYYGDGCYGAYPMDSPNYHGKASCLNPEHNHSSEYILGDADGDGEVDVTDVTAVQRTLADIPAASFNEAAADIDGGGVDITDATLIQRYLAEYDIPYSIGELRSELPSKVDLRNYNGKNYVTPVGAQQFGDCWAFSLAGAAEITYLFANDMGVPAGQVNDQVNFSEKYISWYMFHGITEDDVVKGKVRASQVGDGFDPSEAESERELTPYFIGGPFVHDANLFGSGFGPVDESVEINGEYPFAYDDEAEVEWFLPLNAEYRSAPATGYLRSSIVLRSPAVTDEEGVYSLDESALNAIKSEIYKGHGVSLGFCASGSVNQDNKAVYHSSADMPNHAVVAVGYDDNYPKEKFTRYRGGKEVKGSTPPADGALILKNSWGTDDDDDGFFYLSYYDQTITTALSYVFGSDKSLRHTARNIDQYDLMMTDWYGGTDHTSDAKTANVFDAEEDSNLYQIAYRTSCADTEVSYAVYKNIKNNDPSSGVLLEKGVNRHIYPGFYTIDLRGDYALKKGDKYSVVLTMKRVNERGISVFTEVFPYSTEFFDGMTVTGIINKGESYLYTDGRWIDMADMKDSLKERAYQYCSELLDSDTSLPPVDLNGADDMAVDNYPIKAILAPVGK